MNKFLRRLSVALCSVLALPAVAQLSYTVTWPLGESEGIGKTTNVVADEGAAEILTPAYAAGADLSVKGAMTSVTSELDEATHPLDAPFTQYVPSAVVTTATIGHHLDFNVTVAKGHTFKPTVIAFDAARCGTDKGAISVRVKVGSAPVVTLNDVTLLRNKISESNPNGYGHHEFILPDFLIKDGELFHIYIFVSDVPVDKGIAFRNVSLSGRLDEPVYSVADLVSSFSCSAGDLLTAAGTLKNGEQVTWGTKLVGDPTDFAVEAKEGYTAKMKYEGRVVTLDIYKADELVHTASVRFFVTNYNGVRPEPKKLRRGLVAAFNGSNIFLSWRRRKTDDVNTRFYIYRNGVLVNKTPLYNTNMVDAQGNKTSEYMLKVVDKEGNVIDTDTCKPWTELFNYNNTGNVAYLTVPTVTPTDTRGLGAKYTPNDATVCDMDGDGEYEIVVKWDPSNSKDAASSGVTSDVYIDCYKLDGTQLWRINLGKNIRAGAHTTPFLAYDFDQDGFGELVVKTAPGTVDGEGNYVVMGDDDPTKTWYGSNGKVTTGPEYLTIFDGITGAEIHTVAYHTKYADLTTAQWGDSKVNRSERYLACMAYLDGKRPSAVFIRGYYNGARIGAYDFDGKELKLRWLKSDLESGKGVYGEGAHSVNVADLDGDGMEEIVFGSGAIDHDGSTLYRTGLGHGDALHTGDFIPSRPGLETFMVHEKKPYGYDLRDARTGEIIWRGTAEGDTGRGLIGDFSEENPGSEFFASSHAELFAAETGKAYNAKWQVGSVTSSAINYRCYWDGDLQDEYFDRGHVDEWDDKYMSFGRMGSMPGSTINDTKRNPNIQADFLGDWREEIVTFNDQTNALLVATTIIPSDYSLVTLMDDRQYDEAIVWQNVGYNQPPHLSYDPVTLYTVSLEATYVSDQQADAGWNAYCAPYALRIPDGVKVFAVNQLRKADKMAALEDITKGKFIPAGTPFLVLGRGVSDFKPTQYTATVSTNRMRGVVADTTLAVVDNYDFYVLGKKESGVGFYKVSGELSLHAGDVYCAISKSADNIDFYALEAQNLPEPVVPEENAIQSIHADGGKTFIYDMSGRRVKNISRHGIYIVNGQKQMF